MKITFKTKWKVNGSSKHATHTVNFPDTLADKKWTERFFTDEQTAVKTLAGNWVIKFQSRLRATSGGVESEKFCFGTKYGRQPAPPTVVDKELKWTEAQLKELKAQGIILK